MNYLSVVTIGNNTQITTVNDNQCTLPTSTIENITKYTNGEEETLSLVSFLKDKHEECTEVSKQGFSASFVEKVCVRLMSEGFVPDQIILALEQIPSSAMFGAIDPEFMSEFDNDIVSARVDYIAACVKDVLGFKESDIIEQSSSRRGN